MPGCDQPLLGDFSQGVFRPLVPVGFRKKVFDSLHALSHPGVRASQKLVGQSFSYTDPVLLLTDPFHLLDVWKTSPISTTISSSVLSHVSAGCACLRGGVV